jgi:hypothetical protein
VGVYRSMAALLSSLLNIPDTGRPRVVIIGGGFGGMHAGVGKHEKVGRETKKLVENAQKYLDKAKKTDSTPLPDRIELTFTF